MKHHYFIHIAFLLVILIFIGGFFYEGTSKPGLCIILSATIILYLIFILLNLYVNSNIKRKKVYLAGPYSGDDEQIKQNILKASNAAQKLRNQGYNVFLPHSNFMYCDDLEGSETGRREIMALCKEWIEQCDLFAVMPGWDKSSGAREEFVHAENLGKEIIYLT